ncbi:acetyl-CoA C-acetyltransferase [Cetobacterium sp. 8H]|uniref:acetyl-CoA C-acetyltransferase n=1 Tax=Cetobacterium sp. 8H TaxID=2759681 RepID=UPI00163CA42B|nr:acetyl-CoA C-acetyltransferase [Cetobacterium sp. 8H]MBC2849935.1 acetyl-CoA C-acetyltransferase [Cetobacterium sp. 8H]
MSKIYIVDAKRTAIGSFLGSLRKISPSDLGATVVKDLLKNNHLQGHELDEVIMGNILSAGQGQGVGRQVAIKANIPFEVPAYSLNILCGSGMKSVMTGYSNIKSGLSNLVICGGVEVMSQAPFVSPRDVREGFRMGELKFQDSMLVDALTDAFDKIHMGVTAENIAEKYSITREEQDRFAIKSQEKAIKAIDEKKFEKEIVPVEIVEKKQTIIFDTDEYPNRKTSLEKLGTLKTVFKKDGTVTAGNASGINDGASAVLLASEEAVKKYNLKPLAEIVGIGQGGVDPKIMGMGPVPAIKEALKMANLDLQSMDLVELNEAFAAQALGVMFELKNEYGVTDEFFDERCNVNGGAIALGHPVGASGNRIITTLVHEMSKRKSQYGLASLCIGGGMGTAVVVKSI